MPVMSPEAFVGALRERGFDFFAGVPCSLVKGLLAHLGERDDVPYLPATREDSALGVAVGAWLGGRRPVVIMQNSGLGVSINALASLLLVYRIPCLLLITWRGHGGKDAPEHQIMGPAMTDLLDSLGIPHRTLENEDGGGSSESFAAALAWADGTLRETHGPCALLVRKGAL